jgi:uncharacterized protein (DUF58 family)
VIRELLYFRPEGKGTDISKALEYMNSLIKKRSVVFLISDFMTGDFQKVLRVVSRKHDLISISIRDPREEKIPNVGLVRFEDAETGKITIFDTSLKQAREAFTKISRQKHESLLSIFKTIGIDCIQVQTDRPYDKTLIGFFRERARRFR